MTVKNNIYLDQKRQRHEVFLNEWLMDKLQRFVERVCDMEDDGWDVALLTLQKTVQIFFFPPLKLRRQKNKMQLF